MIRNVILDEKEFILHEKEYILHDKEFMSCYMLALLSCLFRLFGFDLRDCFLDLQDKQGLKIYDNVKCSCPFAVTIGVSVSVTFSLILSVICLIRFKLDCNFCK